MRYRRLSYGYALVLTSAAAPTHTAWRPAADVYETPRTISVTVEVPGIEPEGLEVMCFENAVVVEGQRELPTVEASGIYHTAEIRRGPFRLEVPLPARVNTDPLELRSEQGMLSIRFEKAEA
jgi:HSP20 family protein